MPSRPILRLLLLLLYAALTLLVADLLILLFRLAAVYADEIIDALGLLSVWTIVLGAAYGIWETFCDDDFR